MPDIQPLVQDRKQHLTSLKERLIKYKLKNELVTQREAEEEARLLQKERLEEQEQSRLETERQHLLEELQRVSAPLQPSSYMLPPQQHFFMQQQQQQLQHQQQLFTSQAFGYPTITEKEAIDWLKNGF